MDVNADYARQAAHRLLERCDETAAFAMLTFTDVQFDADDVRAVAEAVLNEARSTQSARNGPSAPEGRL